MSGHSKWHNIALKKGKTDAKKAGVFSKLVRLIVVAAREGGGDPAMNFRLRMAIDKAKEANVPKDNIDRAVARGSGNGEEGRLETVVYEAMGPGGAALLVEAITDNRNRTNGNLRSLMTKHGLNPEAKVMWQFEHKGVVRSDKLDAITNWDDFELAMIEAGADDIIRGDGLQIICSISLLQKMAEAVKAAGVEVSSAELEYVAKEALSLDDATGQKLASAIETIEEDDDVSAVYTNAV